MTKTTFYPIYTHLYRNIFRKTDLINDGIGLVDIRLF